MVGGSVPEADFVELKSEVHHLASDVNELKTSVKSFARVANEVHYLSKTIKWAGGIVGAVLATGIATLIWRLSE